ncbi:putative ribonuclease H-like domain-containing protein [Tanacetum coccineum]
MRMEQYLTNTDYSLWQVILNGDGLIQVTTDEKGVETEVPPKTAQALLARQRERKAKSIMLLAIPDEYQLFLKRENLSYSGLDEFKEPEFKGYGSENSKQESNIVCDQKSDDSKENSDDSLVKEQVSKDTSSFVESSLNVDKETIFPVDKKVESVKPKNHEKPVKKSVRYAEMYRSQTPRGNQRNWNGQKSNQLGSDFVMYNKACFICGSFDHVQAHCKYHQRERMVYGNNYNRVNYNYTTKRTHPNAQRNMVPRAVLMKTGLKPFNTARTVNTAHPKSTVFSAKPMSRFSKTAQSTVRRPFQSKTVLSNKRFTHKVNTAKAQAVNTARPKTVNTARPKTVKTARPNSVVVNAVRVNHANAVKTLACWVWRPTKPDSASITLKKHNYIDAQGRSKYMTGNIAYLSDFKEFDRGYVTFGGGAHGGRISGKGTFKTDSLDFEDVFLSMIKFNLLSVSQMCGQKELWRLGQINFQNINKLVKDNLVRGLPTKCFENDQTCVACLKGKQHRASLAACTISNESVGTQGELNADVSNGEPKSATDDQKQVEDGPHNESDEKDKSEDDSSPKEVNAAGQHVNTASHEVNTGRFKLNTIDPSVNTASSYELYSPKDMFKLGASHTLETTHVEFFSDEDEPEIDLGNITNSYIVLTTPNTRIHKDHPIKNMIGDKTHDTLNTCLYACFLSLFKPTSIAKALSDSSWVEAMQEELLNKKVERGIVIRNKARLVAQGYRQEEGEECRIVIYWNQFEKRFMFTQTSIFKDPDHPNKVYKVVKALYRLRQAPRAWVTSEEDGDNLYRMKILAEYVKKFNYTDVNTICIIENPVQHSKTKHIEIRHHFIRDCNAKKLIQMVKIHTDHNVADLLTKGFDAGRFQYLVSSIGMLNP